MTDPAEMVRFIDEEIASLRMRIGKNGNAVQEAKLSMLRDMRDYIKFTSPDALERRRSA